VFALSHAHTPTRATIPAVIDNVEPLSGTTERYAASSFSDSLYSDSRSWHPEPIEHPLRPCLHSTDVLTSIPTALSKLWSKAPAMVCNRTQMTSVPRHTHQSLRTHRFPCTRPYVIEHTPSQQTTEACLDLKTKARAQSPRCFRHRVATIRALSAQSYLVDGHGHGVETDLSVGQCRVLDVFVTPAQTPSKVMCACKGDGSGGHRTARRPTTRCQTMLAALTRVHRTTCAQQHLAHTRSSTPSTRQVQDI